MGAKLGKAAVLALPDSVLRDATRPVADYRDKTVLAFDRERRHWSRHHHARRDPRARVDRREVEVDAPRCRALPTREAVTEFLEKLGAARVKEFAAETPASLQSFGLDRPVRVDIHTGRDKDRATKTLLVGRVDATKQGVYAMRPGEPSVLLLPEEV